MIILKRYLKKNGTITVIEGDHGSAYFYPDSEAAHKAIESQVELQRRAGGNANIGRALHPLLNQAGFRSVCVSPRMVYVDPAAATGGRIPSKKTVTAMIEGVRAEAIDAGIIGKNVFDKGIRDLYRTAEPDGVFCYTFFKATGYK